MAKTKVKLSLRPRRVFSIELKKKLVKQIESGKVNVAAVSREYQVTVFTVYKWLRKFSSHLYPTTTIVIQMDSEQYRTKELEKRVAELEAVIGRKQLELDFLNKLVEKAEEDLGIDIKKNTSSQPSTGSTKTKGNTNSL